MTKKSAKPPQEEAGAISLLIIAFVFIAISLSYGIVAVAETLIQKKEAMYGAQSSASAASYVYAQTYVKKMHECVKTKISEEVSESVVTNPNCDTSELQACLDSDFKSCDVDLDVCIPDESQIVDACTHDDKVLSESMDAAQSSAQTIAQKYKLKDVHLSLSDDTMRVSAQKELESQVPVFGSTGKIDVQAKSSFTLAKKDN